MKKGQKKIGKQQSKINDNPVGADSKSARPDIPTNPD